MALRPMDPLIMTHKLVLASAPAADGLPQAFTSEWMASARWHPFWLFALARVVKAAAVNGTRCLLPRARGCTLACYIRVMSLGMPQFLPVLCNARTGRREASSVGQCMHILVDRTVITAGNSVLGSVAHCETCHLSALHTSAAARHFSCQIQSSACSGCAAWPPRRGPQC